MNDNTPTRTREQLIAEKVRITILAHFLNQLNVDPELRDMAPGAVWEGIVVACAQLCAAVHLSYCGGPLTVEAAGVLSDACMGALEEHIGHIPGPRGATN